MNVPNCSVVRNTFAQKSVNERHSTLPNSLYTWSRVTRFTVVSFFRGVGHNSRG